MSFSVFLLPQRQQCLQSWSRGCSSRSNLSSLVLAMSSEIHGHTAHLFVCLSRCAPGSSVLEAAIQQPNVEHIEGPEYTDGAALDRHFGTIAGTLKTATDVLKEIAQARVPRLACMSLAWFQQQGWQLDVVHSSIAVNACAKCGQWVKALKVLSSMARERIDKHTITCSAAISACEKGGRWGEALAIWEAWRGRGSI